MVKDLCAVNSSKLTQPSLTRFYQQAAPSLLHLYTGQTSLLCPEGAAPTPSAEDYLLHFRRKTQGTSPLTSLLCLPQTVAQEVAALIVYQCCVGAGTHLCMKWYSPVRRSVSPVCSRSSYRTTR